MLKSLALLTLSILTCHFNFYTLIFEFKFTWRARIVEIQKG